VHFAWADENDVDKETTGNENGIEVEAKEVEKDGFGSSGSILWENGLAGKFQEMSHE
jgi:hypothetical protein